jgi:hypothetical protein
MLGGERYLNEDLVLSQGEDYRVVALVHSSLDDALAGFHQLDSRKIGRAHV